MQILLSCFKNLHLLNFIGKDEKFNESVLQLPFEKEPYFQDTIQDPPEINMEAPITIRKGRGKNKTAEEKLREYEADLAKRQKREEIKRRKEELERLKKGESSSSRSSSPWKP